MRPEVCEVAIARDVAIEASFTIQEPDWQARRRFWGHWSEIRLFRPSEAKTFVNTCRLMVTNPANSGGPVFKPWEFASIGYLGGCSERKEGAPFSSRIANAIHILSTSRITTRNYIKQTVFRFRMRYVRQTFVEHRYRSEGS